MASRTVSERRTRATGPCGRCSTDGRQAQASAQILAMVYPIRDILLVMC